MVSPAQKSNFPSFAGHRRQDLQGRETGADFENYQVEIGSIRPATALKLPAQVGRLQKVVEHQVEAFTQGDGGDAQKLRESLTALTSEARRLRPLNPQNEQAKKTADQVAHLHGLACRIAAYTGFLGSQLPPGLTMAAAQAHLQSMSSAFGATVEDVFSSPEAASVNLKGLPPRPGLVETVEVPGGPFKMGFDNEVVDIPAFKISKYPVTNAQYLEFVQSTDYQSEGQWAAPEGGAYPEGPESLGNHPARLTYYDLKAFAKWVGGHIPTREQWEKAGRGTEGNRFPWGNDWRPELVNHDSGGSTPVNQFEQAGNVSPYGAVDMVGNVLEWVDGGATRRPGAAFLKGGAWTNYLGSDVTSSAFDLIRETSETPDSRYAGFGGRVAFAADSSAAKASTPQTLEQRLKAMALQAPASTPESLKPLEEKVETLLTQPSPGEVRTLQDQLKVLCEQVREQHPLSTVSQDLTAKSKIQNVLASANRISYYAGFVGAGSPPVGMTLGQCVDSLQAGLEQLKTNLPPLTETSEISKVEMSDKNPAGIEWVEIPAGEFKFGRDNQATHLPAYRIAKYPITNAQFARFVESTGYQAEGGFQAPDGERGDHPVGNVSFFDMQAFARWAAPGGSLPSEKQWEKAARGTDGRNYPWGEQFEPEKVNHDSGSTISVYDSEKRGNISPFGVVDMVGNCLEWVDESTPGRPGSVLLKGGAYSNSANALKVQSTTRYTTDLPNAAYSGFGGRICAPVLGTTVTPPRDTQS